MFSFVSSREMMGSNLLEKGGYQMSSLLSFEANILICIGEYISVCVEIDLKASEVHFNFETSLISSFILIISDKLSKPWR